MARVSKQEREEAIARLREWVKPGDTIYCILRHVSKSGMSRTIQLVKIDEGGPAYLGYNVALAIGERYDRDREGVKVGGVGMDMGFALVYDLGRALWPEGFECIGQRCQANDHANGDRDYSPHHHRDGGYALRHSWL